MLQDTVKITQLVGSREKLLGVMPIEMDHAEHSWDVRKGNKESPNKTMSSLVVRETARPPPLTPEHAH